MERGGRKVRKCVVPAAGLGTRFLPATKAVPKELLPIVDTPTLQYIVGEAADAGIESVILITARGKGSMLDHFDLTPELEETLVARGKHKERDAIRAISAMASIVSVRQQEPLGLGHAVLQAKSVINDEPFAVILGDDIIDAEVPGIRQLIECHERTGKGVVALMEVPPEETHLYGIAAGQMLDSRTMAIDHMVEKPKASPPSNLAVIGRYVLPGRIFELLENTKPGVGGEIQLTDALAMLAAEGGLVGYCFEGKRYDAGDRLGYIKANVAYAMKRPELREGLVPWLEQLIANAKGR
ncbi:UTP--glucose-1-phosphate uridylyltransferase GalU [Vulgatibacter incomptus]|uniref:UTP--glucose-1-phosphate uridylyltransferase n=1 Tax=Vulgatibacter incomptus TaxID=1391653 RepID=A0A0K1PFA5_9BACT|nr:UTP--glucose-1-phosphate uridylyltransferase GalU [Vulgatibacter incomptus]AKU91789.1 UTP--glucose-1-phosphate uridylyltransferase [Vulgatibacter incomptus]